MSVVQNCVYDFWLCNIPGIGPKKRRILLGIGSPKHLFNMETCEFSEIAQKNGLSVNDVNKIIESRNIADVTKKLQKISASNQYFIGMSSNGYPHNLRNIYDFPAGIYYKGNTKGLLEMSGEVPKRKSVAIVGARGCSNYGSRIAYELAKKLAGAGVNIISGMARGIDSFAHRGAIDAGGRTFAVLAGGVDICYPYENMDLYCKIQKDGGAISEFTMGTQPRAQLFPVRNRIISGLSDAVVVVEARLKSGSLITADCALEQNRAVYVIPGRIGDALSEGCLWLARQGASVLTDACELLEDLGICVSKSIEKENNIEFQKNTLAPTEKMLYSLICLFPKSVNTLIEESGVEASQITGMLLNLELKGLIREVGCHYYCLK